MTKISKGSGGYDPISQPQRRDHVPANRVSMHDVSVDRKETLIAIEWV